MKRIAVLFCVFFLSGCVHNTYVVPPESNLSQDPKEIEHLQKICLDEGIGTINQHFGYSSLAGAAIGGLGFGAIGGAAGGAITGGESQSEYLTNYIHQCMTSKGYILVKN